MRPLRLGLLGTGLGAQLHAQALQDEGNLVRLTAVWGRDRDRLRTFCARWGGEPEEDLDRLLGRSDVDAVLIATPSGQHAALGVRAARAGKHVLVEKPIDVDVARARELVRACAQAGVCLAVVAPLRLLPDVQDAKARIAAGELGEGVLAQVTVPYFRDAEYYRSRPWRGTFALDGGGALINQGWHGLDLLRYLAGEAEWASGAVARRLQAIEAEDTAVAILRLTSGALAQVAASTAAYPGAPLRLELFGTRGRLTLIDGRRDGDTPAARGRDPTAVPREGHRAVLADFARAIAQRSEPAATGQDALLTLAWIEAIYRSARAGGQPVAIAQVLAG